MCPLSFIPLNFLTMLCVWIITLNPLIPDFFEILNLQPQKKYTADILL